MIDQSMSADNFRILFDIDNRKGRNPEKLFFPELKGLTEDISACSKEIRNLRRQKRRGNTPDYFNQGIEAKKVSRAELKEQKDKELMKLLETAASTAAGDSFTIGLKPGAQIRNRQVYESGATAASYFALKHIQRCLRRLYRLRQGNRHHIVCQLRELLSDKMPKYVRRLDLTSFYETIDRQHILTTLRRDLLLALPSIRLITQLLREYKNLSSAERGLPRGIGISAYLAELYMRDFDKSVRRLDGVVYFARYVDDMIVIVVPSPGQDDTSIQSTIDDKLNNLALAINPLKDCRYVLDGKSSCTLDFLGYEFRFGAGNVELGLSSRKLNRYKERIDATVKSYKNAPPAMKHAAKALLIKRIRFLTGNTRLLNNKRNALTGIYFSNALLTSTKSLKGLDAYLAHQISSLSDAQLMALLSPYRFETGFEQKRFHKFSATTLGKIVRAWKYGT